jgi:hypothetical protein
MSVTGLCEVCEQREVVGGCERCGKLVCEKHMNDESGYCTVCYAEVHGGRPTDHSDESRPQDDYPDGVDEYQF